MEVWTVLKSLPFDHCSSGTYMYQGFYFLPVIVIGHTDKHFQLFHSIAKHSIKYGKIIC